MRISDWSSDVCSSDLQALADLRRQFGDRLHLELTRCGLDGEQAVNDFALHASGKLGIPVVASNDVRFLAPEGFDAHEARVCIASGRVLDDTRRPHDYGKPQYLKSSDEMAALFDDVPDTIDNALALAQRCNLELRLGTRSEEHTSELQSLMRTP